MKLSPALLAAQQRKTGRAVAIAGRAPVAVKRTAARPAISLLVPLRTVNPLNNRRHWRTVWVRGKREKASAAAHLDFFRDHLPHLPVVVTLTRIGKRRLDTDGLAASFKHVRDAVAAQYGVDDGDGRYRWQYEQELGKDYAVRIEVVTVGAEQTGER